VIATFTVTPVWLPSSLPKHVKEVETTSWCVGCGGSIRPSCRWLFAAIGFAAAIAAMFRVICGTIGARLGTGIPAESRRRQSLIRALLPPTIALEAGMDSVARMRGIIRKYAPVQTCRFRASRGEDGTDPDGSFVAEFFVPLKAI